MFTVEQREKIRERLLEIANEDQRVVAAAEIGSLTDSDGDRWSDLDLTFGVADNVDVVGVLDDWSTRLEAEHGAIHIFDLPSASTIYRVFLFPGTLQVDLSFTPAADFGPHKPFRPIFGSMAERESPAPPAIEDLFGLGAHHAVRARICIERTRFWQAEYWISAVRDQTLALACAKRGLSTSYGRGFDRLPGEVLDPMKAAMVKSLTRDELLRALQVVIARLIAESGDVTAAVKLKAQLLELGTPESLG